MKYIKKSVLDIPTYSVPQTITRVKLNQNEYPFDIPADIKQEIFRKISRLSWNRYPPISADSLIHKLADHTGHNPKGILAGNGSNELIQCIIYANCDSKNPLVISRPAFSIYKRVAAIMNIKSIEVPLTRDFNFNPDEICKAGKKASLILLDNPNNPSGKSLSFEEIEYIARNFSGTLAIDEAYYEFCRTTVQPLLSKYRNIVILRTFSKAFGAAGIRLGYILGNKEVLTQLKKVPLPFSLGVFQQTAGEILLSRWSDLQKNILMIIQERKRIYRELTGIKEIITFPSQANFICFKPKTIDAEELFQKLQNKNILIRSFSSPDLKQFLRVTIGTNEENSNFITALKTTIKEKI